MLSNPKGIPVAPPDTSTPPLPLPPPPPPHSGICIRYQIIKHDGYRNSYNWISTFPILSIKFYLYFVSKENSSQYLIISTETFTHKIALQICVSIPRRRSDFSYEMQVNSAFSFPFSAFQYFV